MNVKRNILLNPGPATTTDSVKMSQVVPDICPREEEFATLVEEVKNDLTRIVVKPEDYNDYDSVLIGGSGTAVMDAIVSSFVTGKLLVVNNGAYGKRIVDIATSYKLDVEQFECSSSVPVSIEDLETVITSMSKKPDHLAIIHHETTTGILNDIKAVGDLCRKYNVELIVDAISSYAAIPIDMKEMNISFLATTSNKNLQGMAGIGIAVCNLNDLMKRKDYKAPNFYLNLFDQYINFKNKRQMRFTPPVQTFYALKQAVKETLDEGVEDRYARYSGMWKILNDGLKEQGFDLLIKEEDSSKLMTTIFDPKSDRYSFNEMHDYFYEKGITIYPGKVSELNTFRIANIGALENNDIKLFLKELKNYMETLG